MQKCVCQRKGHLVTCKQKGLQVSCGPATCSFSQQSHPKGPLCWTKMGFSPRVSILGWKPEALLGQLFLSRCTWDESLKQTNDIPSLSLHRQRIARPESSKWRNDPPETVGKWVQESLSYREICQLEMHTRGAILILAVPMPHTLPSTSFSKVQEEKVNAMIPTVRQKVIPIPCWLLSRW